MGPPPPERGQATVELALALPFVVSAMLLVVQVLVVGLAQLEVHDLARGAARGAAVGTAASPGGPGIRLEVTTAGGSVTVVVHRQVATTVPLVGALVPDVVVSSSATFRMEGQAARLVPAAARGHPGGSVPLPEAR